LNGFQDGESSLETIKDLAYCVDTGLRGTRTGLKILNKARTRNKGIRRYGGVLVTSLKFIM